MDRFNEKQLIILIIVVSVFLSGILGAMTYLDFNKIKAIEAENLGNCTKIDTAKAKISKIKKLEWDVIVLRENLNDYVKILPDDQEINDFVNRISQFSQKTDTEVISLTDKRDRRNAKGNNAFESITYRMRLRSNLSQFMKFINFFENFRRFVRINSFTIRANKNPSNRSSIPQEMKHDINLEVETFVYNPGSSGAAKITIPEYGKKKDQLLEEIIKARNRIRIQKYDFQEPLGRRDPFVDPRIGAGGNLSTKPGDLLAQRDLVKRGKETLVSIQELIQGEVKEDNLVKKVELKKEIDDKMREFLSFVKKCDKEHTINFPAIKDDWSKNVVTPFQAMLKERKLREQAEQLSAEELARTRDKMRAALREGDPALVLTYFKSVQSGLSPEGRPEDTKQLIIELLELKVTADKIIEFSQKKIFISGIIHRKQGSVALINDKVLGEGDPFDTDLIIKQVYSDRVEFDFKGITVSKGLK